MAIFKWRLFCITEGDWVEMFNESQENVPIKCPNDHSHEINNQSQGIIQKIEDLVVKIKQESVSTQGNFRIEGKKIENIGANSVSELEYSLPHDVNLLAVWMTVNEENRGDVFNAYYQPAALFGGSKVSSNVISVPSYILPYLNNGYVIVYQGVEYEIFDKDGVNIILDSEIPGEIGGALPELKFRINGVRNFNLASVGRHCVGTNNMGSSYMPKEGKVVVKYSNYSNVSKNFYYDLEYMY